MSRAERLAERITSMDKALRFEALSYLIDSPALTTFYTCIATYHRVALSEAGTVEHIERSTDLLRRCYKLFCYCREVDYDSREMMNRASKIAEETINLSNEVEALDRALEEGRKNND